MANGTASTRTYSTPYNTLQTVYGQHSPGHTTNISLGYSSITFLTPWPYLIADSCLSFLIAFWGWISKRKSSKRMQKALAEVQSPQYTTHDPWKGYAAVDTAEVIDIRETSREPNLRKTSWFQILFDGIATVISTIRCVTTFISALHALMYSSSRFRSPAALGLLVLSIVPFVVDTTRSLPLRTMMFTNAFLAYAALQINFISRWRSSWQFYGKWFLEGGECPLAVRHCPKSFNLVGCGLQNLTNGEWSDDIMGTYDFNEIDAIVNYVPSGDFAIGIAMNMGGVLMIASIGFLFIWLYMVCKTVFVMLRGIVQVLQRMGENSSSRYDPGAHSEPSWLHPRHSQKEEKILKGHAAALLMAVHWSTLSLLAIIVFSGVFIPLHYFQQTQPRSIWVVDSHGPPSEIYVPDPDGDDYQIATSTQVWDNATTGAWSDCFKVTPPSDKLGFFDFWWHDIKHQPLEYLQVL